MNKNTPHCLIIGGTSGIGLALAKFYLSKLWQVSIVGSDIHKIHELTTQYQDNNHLHIYQCDITNAIQRNALFDELEKTAICQVIYSAGFYYNERKQKLSQSESQHILAVNLQAFCASFEWASELLKNNKAQDSRQQYALIAISSIAGLLDFSSNSLYAKCKRAMINTCQAYRMALAPFDIQVNCIASGYINTEKLKSLNNGNASHKPFLCSVEMAVHEINQAIIHDIDVHIFPKPMKYIVKTLSILPNPILDKIMKLQYKNQDKNTV